MSVKVVRKVVVNKTPCPHLFRDMQRFTALFLALDQTNKTNTKVQALVQYFNEALPEDKCVALPY